MLVLVRLLECVSIRRGKHIPPLPGVGEPRLAAPLGQYTWESGCPMQAV
jgi:hypothetical protein